MLEKTENHTNALQKLQLNYKGLDLFGAGLPRFNRPFTRDTILSGILMRDPQILKGHLELASKIQGVNINSLTGEEPGKIFHEYDLRLEDGVKIPERPDKICFYNASDSTAFYLLGHKNYFKLTNDDSLLKKYKENISLAIDYILNHLNKNNHFIEDPAFCDSDKYALKVTYWKDSELPERENGEPKYPVIYPLVHAQNLAGIRAGVELLKTKSFDENIDKMKKSTKLLFDKKLRNFPIAIDNQGSINVLASDGLSMFMYLNKDDLDESIINKVIDSSKLLETEHGYRATEQKYAESVEYSYHTETLWPFEQAQIHLGAKKLLRSVQNEATKISLKHVLEVSEGIVNYLNKDKKSYPEIIILENKGYLPVNCNPQLWTIAASVYFDNLN